CTPARARIGRLTPAARGRRTGCRTGPSRPPEDGSRRRLGALVGPFHCGGEFAQRLGEYLADRLGAVPFDLPRSDRQPLAVADAYADVQVHPDPDREINLHGHWNL